MVEVTPIMVETTSSMGVGIRNQTTTTMATAVIRATQTATEIMATTTATTITATATTTKMATTIEKTIRQNASGRMGFVITWGQPAELLLMTTKPPPLEPTAWAAVGATSDPLDWYRNRIN